MSFCPCSLLSVCAFAHVRFCPNAFFSTWTFIHVSFCQCRLLCLRASVCVDLCVGFCAGCELGHSSYYCKPTSSEKFPQNRTILDWSYLIFVLTSKDSHKQLFIIFLQPFLIIKLSFYFFFFLFIFISSNFRNIYVNTALRGCSQKKKKEKRKKFFAF